MKKLLLIGLAIVSVLELNAQIVTAQDVDEAIAEIYGVQPKSGKEYMELADRLVSEYPLDQNNQISFTTIIDAPGKNKEELFVLLTTGLLLRLVAANRLSRWPIKSREL